MILKHKNLYKIKLKSADPPIVLPSVLISNIGGSCGDRTPNEVFIEYQVDGVLTLFDVLYNDSAGTSVFIGGDGKYIITIDGGITNYTITVTNFGVIDSITICAEPEPRVLLQISEGSVTPIDCSTLTNVDTIYAELQNPTILTSGDIGFNLETGGTPYNGNSLYYTVNIPSLSKKYLVIISDVGEFNIISLCI